MKRTAKTSVPSRFSDFPKSYAALCAILMPRTIHDEIELGNVTEIIDLMAGHKLNADQADYLNTLATLAADFEDQNVADLPKPAPNEFLSAHLTNIGMSGSEWGALIGIDRSTASRLLRGERGLNANHIRNTAKALHIAPEMMINGTPDLREETSVPRMYRRGHEIRAWLEAHPEVTRWVVLDDERLAIESILGIERCVFTNPNRGLTTCDAERAVGILNS